MALMKKLSGWQDAILERIESGVDVTQIEERLRLTPTERLEAMLRFLEFLEGARPSNVHRPTPTA
jgi:hypothetical protein